MNFKFSNNYDLLSVRYARCTSVDTCEIFSNVSSLLFSFDSSDYSPINKTNLRDGHVSKFEPVEPVCPNNWLSFASSETCRLNQ